LAIARLLRGDEKVKFGFESLNGTFQFQNRSILLDAVIAAGSNPTVTFLKEAILSRRLTKSESLQAISGFPLYVRTPTAELLNELFVTQS
jgi:hypothetical protein